MVRGILKKKKQEGGGGLEIGKGPIDTIPILSNSQDLRGQAPFLDFNPPPLPLF